MGSRSTSILKPHVQLSVAKMTPNKSPRNGLGPFETNMVLPNSSTNKERHTCFCPYINWIVWARRSDQVCTGQMVLLQLGQSIHCCTTVSHSELYIEIPDIAGLSATADLFLFLQSVPRPIVPSVPLVAQESYNSNWQHNLHNKYRLDHPGEFPCSSESTMYHRILWKYCREVSCKEILCKRSTSWQAGCGVGRRMLTCQHCCRSITELYTSTSHTITSQPHHVASYIDPPLKKSFGYTCTTQETCQSSFP